MTIEGRSAERDVVLTGASSGIGLATARTLARHGVHVLAGVRRADDADRLRAELGSRVTPLLVDVTNGAQVADAAERVREVLGGRTLWGLVNNAGIGIGGALIHQPLDEVRRHFEVNVIGALAMTQALAPQLGADRTLRGVPGRIVNMSSVAGRMPGPFLGAYATSKHALEGLSDSLRQELLLYGIDVIVIEPGPIATPIWDKAEAADMARYARTDYAPMLERFGAAFIAAGRRGLKPERVADVVWRALSARRPRARYVVTSHPLLTWTLPRMLPTRAIDWVVGRALGLRAAAKAREQGRDR